MNANPYANGSVIYTQSGYYAREFARRTDGGQVGINVGIPVPVGFIPFSGHKKSFFGDLHCLGKDAYRFYTESKAVTTHWFDEEEKRQRKSPPGTAPSKPDKQQEHTDYGVLFSYTFFYPFSLSVPNRP